MSVNKVILVGNLGGDPEVRYLDSRPENKTVVANFRLATNEYSRDKTTGERKDHTEWHNIVLWRKLAEYAEKFLHKGDKIYIEGRLRTRKWTDKEGAQRQTTEIVADTVVNLTPRRDSVAQQGTDLPAATDAPKEPEVPVGEPVNSADDLPF